MNFVQVLCALHFVLIVHMHFVLFVHKHFGLFVHKHKVYSALQMTSIHSYIGARLTRHQHSIIQHLRSAICICIKQIFGERKKNSFSSSHSYYFFTFVRF